MKLRYEHIKSTCAIGAMLLFLIVLHTGAVYLFAVHKVVTTGDQLASNEGMSAFKAYLEDPTQYQQQSPFRLAHAMHREFGYIRNITIRKTPDHTMYAHIYLQDPWIDLVQQDYVLMQNATAMPKKYLQYAQLHGITQLDTTLADPETAAVSPQLIATLQEIDREIIANSYITCNHLHEIRIRMKKENMELVCNRNHLPDKMTMDRCKKIKAELEAVDRYPEGICADIRFSNQIIVSKAQARR
jgi:hypothetical protein